MRSVTTPARRRADSLAFLRERLGRGYRYFATAPVTAARADDWNGGNGHCSAVLNRGFRVWSFRDLQLRERFLAEVPDAAWLAELPPQ